MRLTNVDFNRGSFVRATEFNALIKNIKTSISVNKYFCTTADIWSGKRRSFFGYTCHWFDEKFARHSVALACRRFSGSHTYDRIADLIFEINTEFGLNAQNTIATVTDNGSNFVKAFKEFGVQYAEEGRLEEDEAVDKIPEFHEIRRQNFAASLPNHQRCACHTLNLIGSTDYIKIIKRSSNIYAMHKLVRSLKVPQIYSKQYNNIYIYCRL